MATLKINPAQQAKLMADPAHYGYSIRFLDKEGMYEVECEFADFQKIKQIIER